MLGLQKLKLGSYTPSSSSVSGILIQRCTERRPLYLSISEIHTHTRLMAFVRDYPGEPVLER